MRARRLLSPKYIVMAMSPRKEQNDWDNMIETLALKVNSNTWLVHRGRFLSTQFLLDVGPVSYLIKIHQGQIISVTHGPFVMPRWVFALRAEAETWAEFWQPHPKPGFHDLMAMLKFRTLKIEGDQYPFMCNLQYLKDVLASLRGSSV
jgi:hypothetical protein